MNEEQTSLECHTNSPTYLSRALKSFLEELGSVSAFRSLLQRLIIDIDARLSAQMCVVIEEESFASLEGAWRGVDLVTQELGDAKQCKVKLLDLAWDELARDLNSRSNMHDSLLYRKVGMGELETAGGQPFGVLMVNYGLSLSVENDYDDLFTAQLLCDLGEVCLCPVIMSVSSDFFGETDAAWMTDVRRLESILNSADYLAWQNLRSRANARFLGLCWPKVLVRQPYREKDVGFRFNQKYSQSSGLWINASFAFLVTILAEYKSSAWFGFLKRIGDEPGTGSVLKRSIISGGRVRVSLGLGKFLSEQGLIPLCESTKSKDHYFFGNRSVKDCQNNPKQEVLCQLQSVLIACRMTHYVKVQIRRLIGQIKTASECQLILNNWLENYCSNIAEASPEILARYPLREARVEVRESSTEQARFSCEIFIQPQYQVDNLLGDIRLVTDFGAQRGGQDL